MKTHIAFLITLLLAFTQCTIEKRLYNSGYHIERKTKFRSENPTKISDSIYLSSPINQKDYFNQSEVSQSTISELADNDIDSTVVIVNNGPKYDIIYNQTISKKELGKKKKQTRLIGVGIPMIGLGAIAIGALSSTGITFATFALGWLCAIAAIVLLVLFIVFLCVPVSEEE